MNSVQTSLPRIVTRRIIIHLDADSFYASVTTAHNPELRGKPIAIQQKQIVVTCNYEARKRGVKKLQLLKVAKIVCPELIIILGEDLTQFRDASKELYNFVQSFSWEGKAERLGLDEIFLDVTDICKYNAKSISQYEPHKSFFSLSKDDCSIGFDYDATKIAGMVAGTAASPSTLQENHTQSFEFKAEMGNGSLLQHLLLGSHLARYIRGEIESRMGGCTCSAGISTSKLLAKLVGSEHKPRNQTTLLPPYELVVPEFLKDMEIQKIPGIGFKTAAKLREWHLRRPPRTDGWGLDARDAVTVGDLVLSPRASVSALDQILSGPGTVRGIGETTWGLLHGVDNAEVTAIRNIPKQISIEDSYSRLDNVEMVKLELLKLTTALITRMKIDLLSEGQKPHWLAKPRTMRLSTRPRLKSADPNTTTYLHNRISRSMPIPAFVFTLPLDVSTVAKRLVVEILTPLFRQLHPGQSGWNLSLLNVAVINIDDSVEVGKQDISVIFQQLNDRDVPPDFPESFRSKELSHTGHSKTGGSEDMSARLTQSSQVSAGVLEHDDWMDSFEEAVHCHLCGAKMPLFALTAHEIFHEAED